MQYTITLHTLFLSCDLAGALSSIVNDKQSIDKTLASEQHRLWLLGYNMQEHRQQQ